MQKYRNIILLALLCGVVFSASCIMLLNIAVPILPALLSFFLLPGALPVALLTKSGEFGPPLTVLGANSLVYSGVAYILISMRSRNIGTARIRPVTIRLALPTLVLLCSTCVPTLNPLWPRGMSELATQEAQLQAALPLGTELTQVRSVLRSKGIRFGEEIRPSEAVLRERDGRRLTAVAGDQILSARFQTGATVFPCGYKMEVFLLFGGDDKLKDRYIHRLRVCP